MEQNKLLSTKEVAERLDLTVTTIYQYVKRKKLVPVYEDWEVDETMLFYESDVEKIENERPEGYTTSEVAKKLGVHQTTISKRIKEGKIAANKVKYRGRMTYFVQEDTLKQLEQSYSPKLQSESYFYHQKTGYYLYQSFLNEQTKEKGRIVELKKDGGIVLTDNGDRIAIDELNQYRFIPQQRFAIQKIINKPGYVYFRFEQPSSLHSFIYEVIESFYRNVSYKNMRLYQSDGFIDVYVKPFLLKQNGEYFSLLEDHIIKGKVTQRHNGILLDAGIERLTIYPTSEQKKVIKKMAESKNITMSDMVLELIAEDISEIE